MHLQISLFVFSLCLTIVCLTNGAPVSEGETSEPCQSSRVRAKPPFSEQEDEFLMKKVAIQAESSSKISWQTIGKEHELKVNQKASGFGKRRSADSLRKHFDCYLRNKMVDWKPRETSHKHGYTQQEEDFINQELLNDSFRDLHLYTDEIWEKIAQKHKFKREHNSEGFSNERSFSGLRHHFKSSMRPGGRETDEVKNRFPHNSHQDYYTLGNENLGKQTLFDLNSFPKEGAFGTD